MSKTRKSAPAKSAPARITLSASRDIPLDRLVLAQTNVRRLKAGLSIEDLAEDIARRTLLQSLSVRPVLDEAGAETGRYEVPAGGRRFQALQLLVQQKRLAKDAPIPCIVRVDGLAEEDSLAENVHIDEKPQADQDRWNRNIDRVQGRGREMSHELGVGARSKEADTALHAEQAQGKPAAAKVTVANLETNAAKTSKAAAKGADDDFGAAAVPTKTAEAKPAAPGPKAG